VKIVAEPGPGSIRIDEHEAEAADVTLEVEGFEGEGDTPTVAIIEAHASEIGWRESQGSADILVELTRGEAVDLINALGQILRYGEIVDDDLPPLPADFDPADAQRKGY